MLWLPLFESFPDDKKTVHLKLLLKCETADAYLPRLWLWALKNRPDGKLLPGDAEDACKWKGKTGRLEKALKEAEWVDPDGKIHKWEEWAGAFAMAAEEERRAERERKSKWRLSRGTRAGQTPGRPAGQGRDKERDNPGTSGGTSRQNVPPESGGLPPGQTRDSRAPAKTREEEDKTERREPLQPPSGGDDAVGRIFDHYRAKFRKGAVYTLTPKRRQKIEARLKELGEDAVLKAVNAAAADNWFRNTCKHNGIEDLLRSRDHAENWATQSDDRLPLDKSDDDRSGFMGPTLEELEGSNG